MNSHPEASVPTDLPAPAVPPDVYDKDYYLTACGGHEEWVASHGHATGGIYAKVFELIGDVSGHVLVDIGTGRGELLTAAVERGVSRATGIEYSPAALELAATTIRSHDAGDRAEVLLADARRIPLPDASADLVTLLDVVEHLTPTELEATLREAMRLLKPGGLLVAHTFPTSTLYRVYAIQRLLVPGRARRWPRDPRVPSERLMHVNEQSVRGLRRTLRRAGFTDVVSRPAGALYTAHIPDERARRRYPQLAKVGLLAPYFVANIWAEGRRPVV